ncbi:hypothetical protein DM806_17125 [Sphingobium lactosutens]|uniref:DNA -binding domain-containing protein n=1 Tax=Sphingobium lactosutens TaxID=522773 RepID=UPI0015B8B8C2|nr:DUF2285 domain-containing protein [Sphingobium lactosutens]NWK97359.1 hypothetical protein [Sphingobium lactosutens]
MPVAKDWRAPVDETGTHALQYSDIAIGYLSRNPRYRADYRRSLRRVGRSEVTAEEATTALVKRWGISFHATPSSAFDPKLVAARPDLSPDNVILTPAPPDLEPAQPLRIEALGSVRARMMLDGRLHVILADADGDVHLWILDSPNRPLAVLLPFGADLAVRMAAAERLRRRLRGLAAGVPPLRPPPSRRRHLLTLLRVLDGRDAGASRRELAAVLIDAAVRGFSAAEWVESRERKRISRWLAEAVGLRDGGYKNLLRGA